MRRPPAFEGSGLYFNTIAVNKNTSQSSQFSYTIKASPAECGFGFPLLDVGFLQVPVYLALSCHWCTYHNKLQKWPVSCISGKHVAFRMKLKFVFGSEPHRLLVCWFIFKLNCSDQRLSVDRPLYKCTVVEEAAPLITDLWQSYNKILLPILCVYYFNYASGLNQCFIMNLLNLFNLKIRII